MPGRMYRSAAHHAATDADLQALAALGLGLVVDLRTPNERTEEPSRRWPGFAAEVIQNDLAEADEGWGPLLREHPPTAEVFRRRKLDWYGRMAFDPRHQDLFRRYFDALATTHGPLLVHCAAGKDRTGVLVALTHHVAGVAREEMLEDFVRSNRVGMLERRAGPVALRIVSLCGNAPPDDAVWAAMAVEAAYLEATLQALAERHGSIDRYLEQALGFDAVKRAGFEARFLG